MKEQLQYALMSLLKQLLDLDVENLAKKYQDIPLETHKEIVFGTYFESLDNFQTYLRKNNKHLMPFRYLFPLADPGPNHMVPGELEQIQIKPFIDQIEAVFKIAFFEEKLVLGRRQPVSFHF